MSIQYKFKPGDLIIQEGDKADRAFRLLQGEVLVFKTGKDGERIPLAKLPAGSTFGEIAVLAATKERTASVIAVTPVKVDIYLDYEVDGLMKKAHPYLRALVTTLLKQVKTTTIQYVDKY